MKRSGAVKFPFSVQLFKFCQKVLMSQKGGKVHDQEVGQILSFNPSDCSHWKRGEKHVRSVFALAKLAEALGVEPTLVHDVASGQVGLEEAYFEWQESKALKGVIARASEVGVEAMAEARSRVESFVQALQTQAGFATPPLYLPEVLRHFAFISAQPAEMLDKLSRILRVKAGQYCIQFRKGDLKPQTRMAVAKDLARIVLEGERARFPELGSGNPALVEFEQTVFVASLLLPKAMVLSEISKLDARKNVSAELATLFWAPKSLVCYQLSDIVRAGIKLAPTASISGLAGAEASSAG